MCQNRVASREEAFLVLSQLTVEDNGSEGLNQGRVTAEGRGLGGERISYLEPALSRWKTEHAWGLGAKPPGR